MRTCEHGSISRSISLPREAISEVERNHGYDRLKELLAIEKLVTGSEVFVSQPMDFGKSLIYVLLPATLFFFSDTLDTVSFQQMRQLSGLQPRA